ncbi:hypothetical protein EWM64_g2030 [Hericium alpestre]|uniref:Uncharacterized protein n=1 Tax=Hericium alpestre TaxID=135208 RepID=A0A4Z0A4M0_9AGAM|nr:hypothetical protein EWM64_g2030 [Hericium alpestre]
MARLTDLSSEVLLLIVQLAMDGDRWRTLSPKTLALISKRFNSLAGIFIFANYKLRLRGTDTFDTCRLTGRQTEEWDDEGVRARLAHLRSKAACVKRLTIVDGGEHLPNYLPNQQLFHHGPPLPSEILPELLETLRALTSLTAIALHGYTYDVPFFAFPEPLWAWLAERKLAETRADRAQVLRPAELTIEYPYDGVLEKLEPYPELKKLNVTVPELFRVQLGEGFFEFVKTPGLEFSVFVGNPCSFKFHIMGAWRKLRERLPVVFEGIDLTQFDIVKTDSTNATIRSVKVGDGPRYQDHIPEPERDRKDEEMQTHYRTIDPLAMARLTDLSSEILLLIVQLAMTSDRWHMLSPKILSLVNKQLNGLCGIFIFAKYTLIFRGVGIWNTCRRTGLILNKWDGEGVRAHLAHLRSKATCVRQLMIVDGGELLPRGTPGQLQFSRGPPFPAEIVPELLETLQALTSLKAISFKGYTYNGLRVAFPESLWEWLAQWGLREVKFGFNFTFSAELGPWRGVGAITITHFDDKSCHAVQVLRPAELTIIYPCEGRLKKFVPYPALRKLDVRVPELFRVRLCKSFFGFVNTPGLEFSVFIGNPREYKTNHLGAWHDLRKYLPEVFNGVDLAQFNVEQSGWTDVTIWSVKAGEKPQYQGHIPNAKQDLQDEELHAAMYVINIEDIAWTNQHPALICPVVKEFRPSRDVCASTARFAGWFLP